MKLFAIVLVFSTILIGISSEIKAQNTKGLWNLREKDSLLEYASQGKYYKGVILNYSSSMHELIPKRPNKFEYIRTGKLKRTQCIYEAKNAEDLVIQIFADFSSYNNNSQHCHTSELSNYNSFRIVGKEQKKMIGYHIAEDENYQSTITKKIIKNHGPHEDLQSIVMDSIIPVAQLNDAVLYEMIKNKNRLLLAKDNEHTIIKDVKLDQLKWTENFYPEVIVGKNQFYLQIEEAEEYKIISIDPQNGNVSVIVEDGYAPRFYNDHLYYMSGDGLIKLNPDNNTTTQILTDDQLDVIKVNPNYTFLEDQLIWGNKNIYVAKIEFLQAFNFAELNEIKDQLTKLQDQLKATGFDAFHILDPYGEIEEVVDAPPKVKFSDLPENEQNLITQIKDLREKKKNLEKKLSEQMKAGALVEKSKRGFMPEEYKLMQHPVTREPIFVTDQMGWPIYTWSDIIFLPSVLR